MGLFRKAPAVLILLSALCVPFTYPLAAQEPTAKVTGLITDASQAAVPDATIEITNVDTDVTARTTSNSAGNYVFPVLKPGTYNMTVHKEGFNQMARSGLQLTVGGVERVDFALQLGSMSESVTVSAAA